VNHARSCRVLSCAWACDQMRDLHDSRAHPVRDCVRARSRAARVLSSSFTRLGCDFVRAMRDLTRDPQIRAREHARHAANTRFC
jgi:hypothetical protein